jgi:hypothetical protein
LHSQWPSRECRRLRLEKHTGFPARGETERESHRNCAGDINLKTAEAMAWRFHLAIDPLHAGAEGSPGSGRWGAEMAMQAT